MSNFKYILATPVGESLHGSMARLFRLFQAYSNSVAVYEWQPPEHRGNYGQEWNCHTICKSVKEFTTQRYMKVYE